MESKHNLLMKFGQFMSYYKRKKNIRKFYENCSLKTSPRPFFVCKELGITSTENETFEASYLHSIFNSTAIETYPIQLADLLRFPFTKVSMKIKKGLELVLRPHFS